MNNYKYIILLGAMLVLFLASCEDYLTKEIPFEDFGFTPALVINAKISSKSDTLFISVSKNNNYADASTANFELIPDVNVKLKIDNDLEFEAEVFADPSGNYNYFIKFENVELSGRTFFLSATHADYPDASSEIFLPIQSEYISAMLEKDAIVKAIFGYPETFDKLTVRLKDVPGTPNYYAFTINTEPFLDTIISNYGGEPDTFIYENTGYNFSTTSDDPNATLLGNYASEVLFDDKNFDGEEYSFELLFQSFGSENYENYLQLLYNNITESDFYFRQSYQLYQSSQDFGIFSEPVTLYSNIEGGLGLFSGEDRQTIKIE